MNIEQRKEKEIEHILETYSKEVKEYEKIGNRKNFKKIFKEIKKLNKYDIKFMGIQKFKLIILKSILCFMIFTVGILKQ